MVLANAVNASQTGFQSLNATTGVWNGRSLTPGAGISITNQDGTGGNPVITATGMVPDPFSTVYLYDDFLYHDGSGQGGDTNWVINGSITSTAGTATHPGIIEVGQPSASGYILKGQNGLGASLALGNGVLTIEFLVNILATNNATTTIGLGNTSVPAEPTDGVYFLYTSGTNSGQWVGKTANASSRSSANSANAIVGGQWDRLKIIVNAAATSVSFFVNGTEITNSPLAANIPTAALSPRVSVTSSGGGAGVQVDLFQMSYVLTTPR